MTEDLAETLRELGPGYQEVADRLIAARETPSRARRIFAPLSPGLLAAASVAAVAGFAALFALSPSGGVASRASFGCEYRLAFVADEASIGEIIRTQNADGSWKNDFLTKHNATALKSCPSPDARVAYKKAMRNLRLRGVL